MPDHAVFDPLSHLRGEANAPDFDVFLHGMVFLDIIFSGLEVMPVGGEEVWAEGMGSCPGGIANLAVGASRLGLRTSLSAAFGDDDYGEFCWRTLEEQEHIDLSRSRRYGDWHSPVTVSVSVDGDRRMITHGHPAPEPATDMIKSPPRARAVIADLEDLAVEDPTHWAARAREDGSLVFADVGWDPSQQWPTRLLSQLASCHAFMPNAVEAMNYTRTATPSDALYELADLVPLAVVTCGPAGALAIDNTTGEEANVPAPRVSLIDPTGAGDVFGAAMTMGTLAGWPLTNRLSFAALCSALAVQHFGGSLAAPGWGDIADWWTSISSHSPSDSYHRALRRRYEFLDDLVPQVPCGAVRRAAATVARLSDAVPAPETTPSPAPNSPTIHNRWSDPMNHDR